METPQREPELERLERELAERPCPEPSPGLRERVLRHVQAELEQAELQPAEGVEAKPAPRPRQGSGWLAFAGGIAAGVLLWLNLSLSAAQATSYALRLPAEPASIDAAAQQIRELLPEVSPQEARRQAVVLQAGSSLIPCPHVAAGPPARRYLNAPGDLFPQGE